MQRQKHINAGFPGLHIFYRMEEGDIATNYLEEAIGGNASIVDNNQPILAIARSNDGFGIATTVSFSIKGTDSLAGSIGALNGAIMSGNILFVVVASGGFTNITQAAVGSWGAGTDGWFGVYGDANTNYISVPRDNAGTDLSLGIDPANLTTTNNYYAAYIENVGGGAGQAILSLNGDLNSVTATPSQSQFTFLAEATVGGASFGIGLASTVNLYGFMVYNLGTKVLNLSEVEAIGAQCRDTWAMGNKVPPSLLGGV